jgi:glycopeptide antibiotics resistance protein
MIKKSNSLTIVLFIIYLVSLFWIIVYKFGFSLPPLRNMRSINLIPYKAPKMYNGGVDFGEIIMNVVIFIPLGIYASLLFKNWNSIKKLIFIILISLILEVLQYIINIGASDMTDIVNNTAGGFIGMLIYTIIALTYNNSIKTQKFLNILALVSTILILGTLLFLKFNHLLFFRGDVG